MTGCENFCNGYWLWDGSNWSPFNIIAETANDPPNCTPAPKPRVYYMDIGQSDMPGGSAQGGIVIYNNGTITIHTTGTEICPTGSYCFYPGDKDMKPKTYCTTNNASPDSANDPCHVIGPTQADQPSGKPAFCP